MLYSLKGEWTCNGQKMLFGRDDATCHNIDDNNGRTAWVQKMLAEKKGLNGDTFSESEIYFVAKNPSFFKKCMRCFN